MIDKNSFFWNYLSAGQKELISEGLYLLKEAKEDKSKNVSDYSYLVFLFAKAYEGFLKKFFLDLGFITNKQYNSSYFRIGKALNPSLEIKLRNQSVYDKIIYFCGSEELAQELWLTWKFGRNQVCHYFPHNMKSLSLSEAEQLIKKILTSMKKAVSDCKLEKKIL